MSSGIERAIEAAGSQSALGDVLGVTQQFVAKMKRDRRAPVDKAKQMSLLYGIPLEELV